MTEIEINHNLDLSEFYMEEQGLKAYIKYVLSQGGVATQCDFVSTYVPAEWRGRGVAEKLVRTAIQWAKEQGYELQASCWYAAKFIR